MAVKKKHCAFEYHESKFKADPGIVTISCGMDRMKIITFITPGDLYYKGLQIGYEDLIDLEEVGKAATALLQSLYTSDLLTDATWSQLLNSALLSKCLDKKKLFADVEAFVKEHPHGD